MHGGGRGRRIFGGGPFNRHVQTNEARRVARGEIPATRVVNASAAGAHGVSARELRLRKMQLNRADFGIASAAHDKIHTRRRPGQSVNQFVNFTRETRVALATLDSRPVGHQMLTQLNAGTNPDLNAAGNQLVETNVHIRYRATNHATFNHPGLSANSPAYRNQGNDGAGNVTSNVYWNPRLMQSDGRRPAFIGLGHELVHSWRGMVGAAIRRSGLQHHMRNTTGRYLQLRDELETVGLAQTPRHANAPTENALRQEHGVANRTTYSGHTFAALGGITRGMRARAANIRQRFARVVRDRTR